MSGVICDKRVPAKVKRKVYKRKVRSASLFGLETIPLTKRQEAELERERCQAVATRQEAKRKKKKEEIQGCGERGYVDSWFDKRKCRG